MATPKQDMPPPGGFGPVQFERIPLKKYWPGSLKWLLVICSMGIGWYGHKLDKKRIVYNTIENRAGMLSVLPLLLAEYDRTRLKAYRRARDEEAELMKNVEGWKVGTYMGTPVYKSVKPDEWYEPHIYAPWAQVDPKEERFPASVYQDN